MKRLFIFVFILITLLAWVPLGDSSQLYGQRPKQFTFKKDIHAFFNGENQKSIQQYVAENFNLRNRFVRLRNDFSFLLNFAIAPENKNYFLGKENWLFADDFLKHLFTSDKKTRDIFFRENIDEISNFVDFFKKFDIPVVVVIAPEKALTYKEKLPFPYDEAVAKSDNLYIPLESLIMQLKLRGIPVVDGQRLASSQKDKTGIFLPGGIHWTQWGASLFLDEIANAIYTNEKNEKFVIDKEIFWSKLSLHEEEDIRQLQNSRFFKPSYGQKYPFVRINNKFEYGDRNVWVYGDSFVNQLSSAIELSGIAKENGSTPLSNRILSNDVLYSIIANKSAVVLCYTVANFGNGERISRDIRNSLRNFKNQFCIEGCYSNNWTTASATIGFVGNSTRKVGLRLYRAMPSVTDIEVNINDAYSQRFPICTKSRIEKVNKEKDVKGRCLKVNKDIIELPEHLINDGLNYVKLKVSSPVSPRSAGIGEDKRKLGVILKVESM